jgi:hypothetical protein
MTQTESSPIYVVTGGRDDCAVAEGLELPRRPHAGARGVILVDEPQGIVYLLDADDDAQVFRGRERRPLTGSGLDADYPEDGTDHIVRAAYEAEYDVIAAPWISVTPDPEPPATAEAAS